LCVCCVCGGVLLFEGEGGGGGGVFIIEKRERALT